MRSTSGLSRQAPALLHTCTPSQQLARRQVRAAAAGAEPAAKAGDKAHADDEEEDEDDEDGFGGFSLFDE